PIRAAVIGSIDAGGLRRRHALYAAAAARTATRATPGLCARGFFAAAPGVGRDESATTTAAAAPGRGPLDERIQDVGTLPVDVEPDPPERTTREAVALEPRPVLAAVGRLPDAAARPSAVHAARRAPPLIRGRVENLAVGRIHHQVVRAGVVVDLQHLLPGLAG